MGVMNKERWLYLCGKRYDHGLSIGETREYLAIDSHIYAARGFRPVGGPSGHTDRGHYLDLCQRWYMGTITDSESADLEYLDKWISRGKPVQRQQEHREYSQEEIDRAIVESEDAAAKKGWRTN